MLKLGVLTILLFGLSCGADYHLKVHLLGKDGTIQNSSLEWAEGLVLAINGSIVAGFEYKNSNTVNNVRGAQSLCEMMGFETYSEIGGADDFNRTELDEIPYVIQMTNASYNGTFTLGKQYNSTQFLYLKCHAKAQPTPWEFVEGHLVYWDEKTNDTDVGNEGVLIFVFDHEGERNWGTVCGEYFNPTTADIICQMLGYDKADMYGNHSDFRYLPKEMMETSKTVLYDVKCPEFAKSMFDCSYKVGYDSHCTHEQDVVLRCQGDEEEWQFTNGNVIRTNQTTDLPIRGNEGVLWVSLENESTGEMKVGTVCSGDYFNPTTADIACQMMGYDKADMYGNHSDFRYIPESVMETIQPVLYDVNCPTNATSIYDCSYKVGYDNNCTHEQDVVLRCQGGQWEFTEGYLYKQDKNGSVDIGNEGVLVVEFDNERNSEMKMGGTVCWEYFNPTTADIACQILGYDKADMYGNHSDYRYSPKKYMQMVHPIVYDVKCPEYAKSIDDCSYKVGYDNNCTHEEDVVLRCQGDRDVTPTTSPITETTPFTTILPFSTPMNNEVKVDFGGADVQVKVGPQKIHAKLSDIWEEIFGH